MTSTVTSTRAARNSTPAVNLHNENPSLIALGKAHPHEPESDAISGVTKLRPVAHGRPADGGARFARQRTVGRTDGVRGAHFSPPCSI